MLRVLMILYVAVQASSSDLQVNITSNVSLTDNLVCENRSISLTCDAANAIKPEYKWSPSEEINRTIVVTATNISMQYTCTVTDGGHNTGQSSINILSNGSTPLLYAVNFNEYRDEYAGKSVNFIAEVLSSSPPLIESNWSRLHAPLKFNNSDSGRAFVYNYFIGGKEYSSLLINNLSYSDDSGLYSYCASNTCGQSCISVDLHIIQEVECYPPTEPIPILSTSGNQTTIEGEDIAYSCLYGGNYNDFTEGYTSIYWFIQLQDGDHIIVDENSNSTYYKVDKPSQQCPYSNYSCCKFSSTLHVLHVSDILNGAALSCDAIVREIPSQESSLLSVIPRPIITVPLKDSSIKKHGTAIFNCPVNASSLAGLTKFRWLKDGNNLTLSKSKYNITEGQDPDKVNEDSLKSVLEIYDVTKQDEGIFTCLVYYDKNVIKRLHIVNVKIIPSDQVNASLKVTSDSETAPKIVAFILVGVVLVVLLIIFIYKWKCQQSNRHGYDAISGNERPVHKPSGAGNTVSNSFAEINGDSSSEYSDALDHGTGHDGQIKESSVVTSTAERQVFVVVEPDNVELVNPVQSGNAGHQSAGYRVFCDYYNKIMESVDARSLSHYFVSAKLLELENHEKITEPTLSKQQANALLFSKVKDSLEQEGNAELLTEALKVMGDYGDGATKRLSRTIKTALSEVESNQQGKPLESTVVQLENGSSTQLHSVFVNYYSKLVDHFNKDLLLYCVKPEIILPNDVSEIQQCTCNRRAATLLLKKIDGPLRGGDSKNLYEYLKVLEENGTVDIQSLSREIMKQLEEVH